VTETGVLVKVASSLPSSLVLAWALACRVAAIPAITAAEAASEIMSLRMGTSSGLCCPLETIRRGWRPSLP